MGIPNLSDVVSNIAFGQTQKGINPFKKGSFSNFLSSAVNSNGVTFREVQERAANEKIYAATNKKSIALKNALGMRLTEAEQNIVDQDKKNKIDKDRQIMTKAREGASLIAKGTKPLFKPGASLIANMFAMPAHNTNEYAQIALETERKADSIATNQAKTIERFVAVPATVIDFAAEKTAIEMSQNTFG